MKADKPLTYISLFSSAGIGCYGFKITGFDCIATNELIPRRLDIQRYNHKCKYGSGYICGSITDSDTKERLRREVERWRVTEGIEDVTVLVATPPCQGMSVINNKKTDNEVVRNSLVVESITMVKEIRPQFFVFENVPAFLTTACTDVDGELKPIETAIHGTLDEWYDIAAQVINFKDYGANSSRKRTLVIGVRKDIQGVLPEMLFPAQSAEKTLREVIGDMPFLTELGEVSANDLYHAFRPYPEYMRAWISGIEEGQSAFVNTDPMKRPYKIVNGEIVPNKQCVQGKYRRQFWDKVALCVHTRNDVMSSQSTVHPKDDRVFSIREIMRMMTVPDTFQWDERPYEELNAMPDDERKAFLRKNAIKIRQCLGEAVPTEIFRRIAENIKQSLA